MRFIRPLAIAAVVALAATACSGGEAASSTAGAADTTTTSLAPDGDTTSTTAAATSTEATNLPVATGPATLSFSEQTAAAGLGFTYLTPFSEENYTPAMDTAKMRGGATAGDFDNDGNVDLFVLGGGLEDDALFRNNGDGTFTDVAATAGVQGERHLGSGATVGDYDGDGWLDLFVTSHGPPNDPQPGYHRLFHNNGDGTFTEVAAQAGVQFTARDTADGFGSVFGDYDLDGDLDLFVAGWVKESRGNRLFRNNGDGTFTDVTDEAGVVDDGIRGFSPCLVDTDGDRYPEILLVADFGTSRYFVNNADGTFTESTVEASVGREWSGMGTAIGDWNNDLLIDWYVTAIFDDSAQGRGDGNKLYFNNGDHTFEEVASDLAVDDGGWGWGAVGVDLNHDGWLDIVETNGWHFPEFEVYTDEPAKVWISEGSTGFTDVAEEVGLIHTLMGLGMIRFDYDNDGDQDIAITAARDAMTLYRNDLQGAGTSWLRVFLDTEGDPDLPPNGIGSMVYATAGDRTLVHHVGGCSNYNSHSELSAHFGLADAAIVDELRIEWPNGSSTVLTDVAVDQTITVTP